MPDTALKLINWIVNQRPWETPRYPTPSDLEGLRQHRLREFASLSGQTGPLPEWAKSYPQEGDLSPETQSEDSS